MVKQKVLSTNADLEQKIADNFKKTLLEPMLDLKEDDDRHFVTALARGLELLRCFSGRREVLGNLDLSNMTGLPKATVTRLTHTLVRLGYLIQVPNSTKYQLHTGVLTLGYEMLANLSIRAIAHPLMEELAEYTESAIAMASRDRLNMVYLDVVPGKSHVTMRRHIGSQLPIHLTAIGKACLAVMPDYERDFLLDAIKERNVENWPKIKASLEEAFRCYEENGYCLSMNEWHKDVNSVAVPLLHQKHGLMSFNCGGPSFHLTQEKLVDDVAPRLKLMVENIAQSI
nr:IclR family transcriptional regulator [Acinetobacter sp. Marseille-Q1620]